MFCPSSHPACSVAAASCLWGSFSSILCIFLAQLAKTQCALVRPLCGRFQHLLAAYQRLGRGRGVAGGNLAL